MIYLVVVTFYALLGMELLHGYYHHLDTEYVGWWWWWWWGGCSAPANHGPASYCHRPSPASLRPTGITIVTVLIS